MSLPRLTLEKFCGTDAVGYYTAVSALSGVSLMVVAAIGQTVTPRLARYYTEHQRAFRWLLLKVLLLLLVLGLAGLGVAVIAGKLILSLLFKPEYAAYNGLLIKVMLAGTMLFLFTGLNMGLTATRRFGVQLPIYAAAALACGVSSYLLIPWLGVDGAAWAVLICYSVGSAGCAVLLLQADRASPAAAAARAAVTHDGPETESPAGV
jgi:O-antigen/teichoic acid export membrane protein